MNPGVIIGIIGGIVGTVIGIGGGAIGTYFGIKSAKSPRERAFAIRASIAGWIFVLAFVLGMCLLPGFYKLLLVPIYVVGLLLGIIFTIRKMSQIHSEDSKRAA